MKCSSCGYDLDVSAEDNVVDNNLVHLVIKCPWCGLREAIVEEKNIKDWGKMADKETMAALHEQERIIKLIKTMRDTMFSSPEEMDKLIKVIQQTGPWWKELSKQTTQY